LILQGVKTIEDAVMEVLLSYFVPHMLDRIEFRGIGWQRQQLHVRRRFE
jgi:hypothetical protein